VFLLYNNKKGVFMKFTGKFVKIIKDNVFNGLICSLMDNDGEVVIWYNGSPMKTVTLSDCESLELTKEELELVNNRYSHLEYIKTHAWHKRDYNKLGEFGLNFVYNWLCETTFMNGQELRGHSNRLFMDNRDQKPKNWTVLCEVCAIIADKVE
jgi:hypothetical protein